MYTIRLLLTLIVLSISPIASHAQEDQGKIVRFAKLVIDSTHLSQYNMMLKEEIQTSLRVEPGVLTLYAVAEKARPTHITILEIYADQQAYQKHITTLHFLKYKTGTLHMVKSLELVDVTPLPGMTLK